MKAASPRGAGALVQIAAASARALAALAPIAAAGLGIGAHWIGYQFSLVYFSGAAAAAAVGMMAAPRGSDASSVSAVRR
jgi:hypothetical protein